MGQPHMKMPHEYRSGSGMVRTPIAGRLDNMPRAYPPIVEHLTEKRKRTGRLGRFSSRNPMLGLTAEDEGSIPMPMPSTQILLPAPMPRSLANRPREQIERDDPVMHLHNWTYDSGNQRQHEELRRRMHEDRFSYLRPQVLGEIGEETLTPKMKPGFVPTPVEETDNTQFELFNGANDTTGYAPYVGVDGGLRVNTRERNDNAGEVNNRGGEVGYSLSQTGGDMGFDPRRSLRVTVEARGTPLAVNEAPHAVDPLTQHPRETHKLFHMFNNGGMGGAPQALNAAVGAFDPSAMVAENRPTNTTTLGKGFGAQWDEGMAADRHQKKRTHLFDHRPEMKSMQAQQRQEGIVTATWEAPPVNEGLVRRETLRSVATTNDAYDSGAQQEALRRNPLFPSATNFYARTSKQMF